MATLVFSTVGTVLGGPLGGAIGALIGQSIDQELLAPARRGPRLGDLSVQTSSYGTQVPRIYGAMRVAGSVVWATDLTQSAATTGAKGQPDTTYSYSVSFAVALSSRPAGSIGRIWADGKLLRGAEGDFKVSTTFRFHDGGEEQVIDPLIGSIEGIANTTAYRGLALAVFENLELAEFGNRIPFLTFEVIADEPAPTIGMILADASRGAIAGDAGATLAGYAAYGPSIRSALQPLVDGFGLALFDDGSTVRSPLDGLPQAVSDSDFGNSADSQQAARIQREQAPARTLPAAMRLSYYDPARDYQAGEARASASDESGIEEQRELAGAIEAAAAKSLVEQILARSWARRDRLTLRLPPRYLGLEPGSRLDLSLSPGRWTVEQCTIDGLVVVAELAPAWQPIASLSADAGRIVQNADIVAAETSLALFDAPDVLDQSEGAPVLLLAASTSSAGWKSRAVAVDAAGQTFAVSSATRKSVLGRALDRLVSGEPYLIDESARVEVELADAAQWLVSCDDESLGAGSNLAILGSELIQFGEAVPSGPGRFQLARLLRGRAGTEWASASHAAGDAFVLVERDALRAVRVPAWAWGSTVTAAAQGIAGESNAEVVVSGQSLRPLSPIKLTTELQGNGDLRLSWTRRSRKGWSWIDGVDAPLGEAREGYVVTLLGTAGTFEVSAAVPEATVTFADLASVGSGPATVEVRQVGDWGLSPPAQSSLIFP